MKLPSLFSKKTYFWWGLVLIIPVFWGLIRPGFYQMQDDLQAFRIQQMDKCFQDRQLPCRWIPDMGYRYGYPQFNFYSPGVYYLGEAFHLVGFQFIDSVKILFILGFIFSFAAMYLLLNSFLDETAAVVGSIAFIYAPSRAVQVYVRGALSEFWALVFFPLIFWAIYKLIKHNKNRYIGFLGLAVGGLLLTHNIMSFVFLPLAGIWAVTLLFTQKKWRLFHKLLIGIIIGAGLSATFTLPLIFERQYVHLESLVGGYFDYRQHFVNLRQLFISNYFEFGSSVFGDADTISMSTGIVHWLAALVGLIIALISFNKNRTLAVIASILAISELGVLFMVHQKSSFIWDKIPALNFMQFPWRFLSPSIFLLSIIAAIGIHLIKNQKIKLLFSVIMVILLLAVNSSFFKPFKWFDITDRDKFSGVSWEKQLTISIFDYLPIYAKLPPNHVAPNVPEVLGGQANFINYQKGSDFQKSQVYVLKDTEFRLPLFDFPGMVVKVDGKIVPHNHDNCSYQEYCFGLINFQIPIGMHKMEARLTNTPIRTAGNTISMISLLGLLLLFWGKKHAKTI